MTTVRGASSRRFWQRYAEAVVRARWAVLAAWFAAAAILLVHPLPATSSGGLADIGAGNAAVAAELRSFHIFGFPLFSRVVLVQHDPEGLSPFTQADAVLRAIALDQHAYDTPLLGALPVPNTFGLAPGARQDGTTVLTYLFDDPNRANSTQTRDAHDFVRDHVTHPDEDGYVGVTGTVPARAEQAHLIIDTLPQHELITVLAVLLVVGLTFRSVVAPLVAIAAAGVSVVVTLGIAPHVSSALGVPLPDDLRPLVVALLLGVVTDYCIFFLFSLRQRLAAGADPRDAAVQATSGTAPVVVVAGITVAAGTAMLLVARSALFRGFGPAMALTVLVGVLVATTLVPALMAVTGAGAFWPSRPREPQPVAATAPDPGERSSWLTRLVTDRRRAALVTASCLGVLAVAAVPVTHLRLGLGFVQSLPADTEAARAAKAATAGFAPGILSPTEVLLEGEGVGTKSGPLRRFGDLLRQQRGVAGVLGPGDRPVVGQFGVVVAKSGSAARYLLVLDSAPLEAHAIGELTDLRAHLPSMLEEAGLTGARVSVAGDTALAAGVVRTTQADLLRISIAALVVNLLMLMVFLRALVAPLYLLAANVLSLGATLGVTVLVFQSLLGHEDLTFYVPFAAAVLLLSLGSDYTIYAVGHIWSETDRYPLREAITVAVPQYVRGVVAAGMALAASFGLLSLVPVRPFAELAVAMTIGILLDTLVLRPLLVPSLMTLCGAASAWPSSRLRQHGVTDPAAPAVPVVAQPG